jgi:hypothetical protein
LGQFPPIEKAGLRPRDENIVATMGGDDDPAAAAAAAEAKAEADAEQRDSDRLIFLGLASLTAALLLLQVARLRGGAVLRTHRFGIAAHIVWTPPHWLRLTLIISVLFFGTVTIGFATFKHFRSAEDVCSFGSAKDVRSWMCNGRRPIICFFSGILVGATVRFCLGNSNVHDFASGSAPIVAALLIAVLVPVNKERHFRPDQQIAVMYLLIGAVAAAIGTFDASGWIIGLSSELILGGIATSIWLVWDILPSSRASGERAPQA